MRLTGKNGYENGDVHTEARKDAYEKRFNSYKCFVGSALEYRTT